MRFIILLCIFCVCCISYAQSTEDKIREKIIQKIEDYYSSAENRLDICNKTDMKFVNTQMKDIQIHVFTQEKISYGTGPNNGIIIIFAELDIVCRYVDSDIKNGTFDFVFELKKQDDRIELTELSILDYYPGGMSYTKYFDY